MTKIIHYPNLRTVLMVERVLKSSGRSMRREELKSLLKKKVMHQTLNVILEYLEESGKIFDGRKGILWIFNPNKKIDVVIRNGREL